MIIVFLDMEPPVPLTKQLSYIPALTTLKMPRTANTQKQKAYEQRKELASWAGESVKMYTDARYGAVLINPYHPQIQPTATKVVGRWYPDQ
jgi:hypothetical protein